MYLPTNNIVKARHVYRDIKSIYFEFFSDNIKTNFENKNLILNH